jgi:Skp family chaperone for outer membrane proteins
MQKTRILKLNLIRRKPMKMHLLVTLFLILGLLSACSDMNPHPMDMDLAVQNAETKADHEALAKHYEETAQEMQAKVDRQKKLLSQYESKSYLYGRQAEDIKEHSEALINSYERAVTANRKMAEMHRGMAQ